ncbi:diguanylate cyclase (GGDEF) domain-containing protein [Cylindrospermum stagnale PCC 7417]|uniref:Diguanylate cyclase (GGDEF) domain-containing protein n=1 Tax=Cylindrospermum stagnale PCC 7417 TaxID=56107 RepID=K9WVR4_9NOST|nr:sensor domain-containing diguanylate cyclase [Cylindrospermum stagnale]AFZ23914.1 diguanylate cyclase (GGDEF) domain-containing protein [Cylindrospermum stagnale PCC 7417]
MTNKIDSPLYCKLLVDSQDIGIQHYLQEMERLLLALQDLSLARSLERIMEIVRVVARELTGSDGASFVLRDNGYCYYADENAIAPLWKDQRFPMDICISGWAMLNRQPAIIDDVFVDERVPYAVYRPTFVKSMVMVPIRTLDPIGAIGTYWAKHHQPTMEEVKLLQALADTTAVAMENVQVYSELEQRVSDRTASLNAANIHLQQEIYEREAAEAEVRRLSLTDDLTGLHNRRGFFLLAEQQLKLSYRSHTPINLLFIDLDGLKTINDTLGHEIGDAAIVAAANLLKETFRNSDTIARLGGDEFVVLMQGNDPNSEAIQERLQAAIDQFNQTQQPPFHISMSIGIQSYDPNQPISLDDLITLADIQMYQQKRAKRANR